MSGLTTINDAVIGYLQQFSTVPIPEKDQELILPALEPRVFKEGEYLFREGRICTQLFFISHGILRILSTNDKGVERTHYFYKEGQFCTILKSFSERAVAEASIVAAVDVEVLVLTRQKLEGLYRSVPYLQDLIDRMFQRQLLEKVETRNMYLAMDAETQYKLFQERQPDIALRVSMKDIASYLGITPQSLSRIRRNLQ